MTDTLTHQQNQPGFFAHLGQTHPMMAELGLERSLSALIELRASQVNQCAYCVTIHLAQARKAGVPQAKLDALVVWREVDAFSAAERAALAWTEALTSLRQQSDFSDLQAEMRAHFPEKQISMITADVGMINLWNRVQRSKH